jgi:hypothetical protein
VEKESEKEQQKGEIEGATFKSPWQPSIFYSLNRTQACAENQGVKEGKQGLDSKSQCLTESLKESV